MTRLLLGFAIGATALLGLAAATRGRQAAETFTDPRDGYGYHVVTIGGARWFAENLRFKTPDSRCYEADEANCTDQGRLYRFDDAVEACPPGWRVPSEDDWRRLEHAIGMTSAEMGRERGRGEPVARRLKFGGDTGFNVRYSGWIDPYRADSSIAMGRNAAWWTSTSGPPDESAPTVWHRDVATDRNSIWRSPVDVTYWLSVRCVRER
jgi:uncharacterized protein (TIGR02145 family)